MSAVRLVLSGGAYIPPELLNNSLKSQYNDLEQINPEFESYIRKNRGKKFGIILMDVPTESLIYEIYSSNF